MAIRAWASRHQSLDLGEMDLSQFPPRHLASMDPSTTFTTAKRAPTQGSKGQTSGSP
jgi:hypothetical protein